jgi:hypothetical protein
MFFVRGRSRIKLDMASPSYAEDGKKVVRRRLPQARGSRATRTYRVVRSLSQVTLALGNRLRYVGVEAGAGETVCVFCPWTCVPWLDKLRDATLVNLIQFGKSCFEPRETGFIRHEFGAGIGSVTGSRLGGLWFRSSVSRACERRG